MASTTATESLGAEWVQTSPSTYERDLDSFDKFFIFIGSVGQGRPEKQNWHVATAIKLETKRAPDNFVNDVRDAWIALRHQFPGYSAVIEDGRWIYRTADDEAELNSWLEETLHIHDTTTKTARQLFPFPTNPSRRVVLHVLPHTQELLLQSPHTHLDAIGSATFFNHMMSYLVAPATSPPAFGTEGTNLSPPCSVLARVPPNCTPAQQQAWDTYLSTYLSNFPTVRLHNTNKDAPAARSNNQWLTFTPTETQLLLSRSRELGLSITSVGQAALSLAARLHGRVPNTTHSTFAIYDARPYVDTTDHPLDQLVGSIVFAMPVVFPLVPDDFVETARKAREVFGAPKKDGDLLRAVSPFWATDIPAALSAPLPEEWPVAADLQMSSVGVMDDRLTTEHRCEGGREEIVVRDWWVSLDMLSPNVAVEMWTFRGSLVIELIYNEAYHRAESIKDILRLIHEQITQGLVLHLGFDARRPGDEEWLVGSEGVVEDGVVGDGVKVAVTEKVVPVLVE
ncbi:hypothetical protein B0T18DRAFT_422946 [Schizothecium vesticola]|uniref:Uncharacterized protein n=1 Tax=Schizothecium vesticola TaxID=314040 RepID=A0AA40BR10_9PEZI|nr:hypothetical protein B0T18DRAFT_422946 [Schizothecium vesticola]